MPAFRVVQLRDPEAATVPPAALTPSSELHEGMEKPSELSRYRIRGELARGGMGVILQGHDINLGRDIAVKVLLERHRGRTELLQRFVGEAQIGGQLQHPSVVPIYELNFLPDKRPYFTMKLVKGRTLAALLAERVDLSQDRPRFLKIFEQVCQALAYAHARGVIHRDLKPLNIMVGSFGEVQVMDWGLAKVLNRGAAAQRDTPVPQPEQTGDVRISQTETSDPTRGARPSTQTGSVLGTPTYMPPEQARGEVDHLDERCDVFGLGAILCEILTGRPPYVGDATQILCHARRGDLEPAYAQLDTCEADVELARLAKCCLAVKPEDRPRDAGGLASALAAYLESVEARLRRAEMERTAAEVRAHEERKRRRMWLALAAAVLALVALGAGGGLWLERLQADQRESVARQSARMREAVEAGLDQATWLWREGRWPESQPILAQAESRLDDSAPDDLRERLKHARSDLDLIARLEGIRLQRMPHFQGETEAVLAAALAYTRTFHEAGFAVEGDEELVATQIHDSAIREQLVAALDDWVLVSPDPALTTRLLRIARLADPGSKWRERLHDPAVRRDRQALERLAEETVPMRAPPQLFTLLAVFLNQLGADPVPVLRAAQRRHPADFWVNFDLARALQNLNPAEAVGFYRAALALRPDSGAVYSNLGAALLHNGNLDAAIAAFYRARELDPNNPKVHDNLGAALCKKGAVEEGIAALRRAIEMDPKWANTHNNLGFALSRKGETEEAIAAYRRAIEIDPKFAKAYTNLGNRLRENRRLEEAIAAHRRAIELNPKDALAHDALGATLYKNGAPDEALVAFRNAIAVNPKHAPAHDNIAAILAEKGRVEEAIAAYREAIQADPNYGRAHGGLGYNLLLLGRFSEACTHTERALELLPVADPQRKAAQQQLELCRHLLALEAQMGPILQGKQRPCTANEERELAEMCLRYKQRYAASARFFAAAFATQPALAANLQTQDRYNAACASALAAAGQGSDAIPLDDQERARLRQQSLAWLQGDLAAWTKLAADPNEHARIRLTLNHWQRDDDLAGIRDKDAIAKLLPEEQEVCKKLWAEVAGLLKRVEKK
jgi:serine/threonine-protein kinase